MNQITTFRAPAGNVAALTDEQFRRLAASLSTIIWRLSASGSRLLAPRWAELTGRSERDLQDNGWLATIHPDDRELVTAELRAALTFGTHFQADARLRMRDGTYHWFGARGEPTRDMRGTIDGWIGVASNIDDQKRAEQRLVENEQWLRMVIDAARVGTIDHDLVTGRFTASPRAFAMLRLPASCPVTFELLQARLHDEDRALFADAVRGAMAPASDGALELVVRLLDVDDNVVWVNLRGTYLFAGAGPARRAVRFVGVAADVTGHMRSLAERSLMSALVESSQDAIIAMTTEGRVTHWNPAATTIYGYEPSEIVGRSYYQLVPESGRAECDDKLARVRRGEQVRPYAVRRIAKSGELVDVSITLSGIRTHDGKVCGYSAIISDIREQKRLEAGIIEAQKMEAVGLLAGGVAHDLNNTLTAILVGLEIAAQDPGIDPATREGFQDVRAACFDSAKLIRQLLAVARRQVINPVPCSVNAVVRAILPILTRLIREEITLTVDLAATHGAFVDPTQLSQILLNLAVNARDAMARGGELAIRTFDAPEQAVGLSVRDTGCGIPPEIKARIFEPFFTTKELGKGTGLGLSTTYGIVAQSGGTITVDSVAGEGSTFTVMLPAVDAPEILIPSAEAPGLSGMFDGDETILLVEDDRTVREQLGRALRGHGYTVIEARNGADALIALENHGTRIHLLLSDVVMPEMGGLDLVARLRGWYPGLRAILMSGYSEAAVENYGTMTEGTAFIQKPLELPELLAAIRSELDRVRTAG